jgi:broad specificity phosphatase PhoE
LTARLILIRHGETDWNVEGRYQGQADPPLNQQGLAQARQLTQELRSASLDVLYSSPLRRALKTARTLAKALDIPLHTDPRLMEIHQGEWQTLLHTEIAARYPEIFHRWQTEPWTVTIPGGENIAQVQERVYAAVDEILARHEGQCIGMVAHRLPIALLKIRYQGLDPGVVRTLELPNTYWEEIQIEAAEDWKSPSDVEKAPVRLSPSTALRRSSGQGSGQAHDEASGAEISP